MAEQFEDRIDGHRDAPPIVRVPTKPTKEEWEKHQTTHTHLTQRGVPIVQPQEMFEGIIRLRDAR